MSRQIKTRTFSGTISSGRTQRETAHREIARQAAAGGMVLLKNERQILPLAKESKVALYGVGASQTVKGGTGSGDVNEREQVSLYQGMKEAGYQICNEQWIEEFDQTYAKARLDWRDMILEEAEKGSENSEETLQFFSVYTAHPFVMPVGGPVKKTEADTAFYILSRVAGEGADRFDRQGDYRLNGQEKQMLDDICKLYDKVVVVLNAGGLVDLSFMDEYKNICGLIQMVQPGMEGGHAFADLVSGRATPSGKMTDSWAFDYGDYPNAETFSHNNDNVEKERYEEGIYVGYRYFDTFGIPVRYGFGFGLSYTDFLVETEEVSLSAGEKPELAIRVNVTNTGSVFCGKEVVQVYTSSPVGKLDKEYRRLGAFAKTKELRPGESQKLILSVPLYQMASFDEAKSGWILEAGQYGIWVGNSLESAKLTGAVELDQTAVLVKTETICPLRDELKELCPVAGQQEERYKAILKTIKEEKLPVLSVSASELIAETPVYRDNTELTDQAARAFTDTLTEEELICLSAGDPGKAQGGNLGAAGISVPGSAGETHSCCRDKGLASIVLADGPAGLRLMQYYYLKDDKIVSMPFQFSLEGGLFCPDADKTDGEKYYQYCTAIPVGTLLAQTFDVELAERVGRMIGDEMEEFGVTLWLAPGMNIHRNPLCGRNFEYYSEDPLVSGVIAAAMTSGVQSVPGCGTTIKHFACNNQEDNRMGSDSILSQRALREIYLKGFEIAIKASQPMAIMTSYNLINGVHAANNVDLCTKAARCEWGFEGMIMTDWTTTGVGDDCTASGCMRAGNDLVMPGCTKDHDNLRRELAEGTLKPEELRACVSRLVSIIWQSNEYENALPYKKKQL